MASGFITLCFHTLAASSGWNEVALLSAFPILCQQMSIYEGTVGLKSFLQKGTHLSTPNSLHCHPLFFTRFHFVFSYCPVSKKVKVEKLSCLHQPYPIAEEPESFLPPSIFKSPVQWALDDQTHAATLTEPAPLGGPEGNSCVPIHPASGSSGPSTPLQDPGT